MAKYPWDRGTRELPEDVVELAKLYLADGLTKEEVFKQLRRDGADLNTAVYCAVAAARGKEPIRE